MEGLPDRVQRIHWDDPVGPCLRGAGDADMISESQWLFTGRCKWCGAVMWEKEGKYRWTPEWDGCLHELEGGEDAGDCLQE